MEETSTGWQPFASRSSDGGLTWSEPQPLNVPLSTEYASRVDAVIDDSGVVWAGILARQDPALTGLPTGWRVHLFNAESGVDLMAGNAGLVSTGIDLDLAGTCLDLGWLYYHIRYIALPPFNGLAKLSTLECPGALIRTVKTADNLGTPAYPRIFREGDAGYEVFINQVDNLWNVGVSHFDTGTSEWTTQYLLAADNTTQVNSPDVAADGDHVVVTYLSYDWMTASWGVWVSVSHDAGTTFAGPVLLTTSGLQNGCPVIDCSENRFILSFIRYDGRTGDIRCRISSSGGDTWSNEVILADHCGYPLEFDAAVSGNQIRIGYAGKYAHQSEIYFKQNDIPDGSGMP